MSQICSEIVSYIDTYINRICSLNAVSGIVLHGSGGRIKTASDFSNYIVGSAGGRAYHYAIADDGTVGMFVTEEHGALATNKPRIDTENIQIIVSTSSDLKDASAKCYQSLLNLCEDICRRYHLSKLVYSGFAVNSTLRLHSWYEDTVCPGEYITSRASDIASAVSKRLRASEMSQSLRSSIKFNLDLAGNNSASLISQATAKDISEGTTAVLPSLSTVRTRRAKLITVYDPNERIEYSKLSDNDVVGIIYCIGQLYDISGMKRQYPIYSGLASAIKRADDNNIPYGLMWISRARTKQQCEEEIKAMYTTVRRYTPELGLWVNMNPSWNTSANQAVLDTFLKSFKEFGYQSQIGIYSERSNFRYIDIEANKDNWYFWMVDESKYDANNTNQEIFSIRG